MNENKDICIDCDGYADLGCRCHACAHKFNKAKLHDRVMLAEDSPKENKYQEPLDWGDYGQEGPEREVKRVEVTEDIEIDGEVIRITGTKLVVGSEGSTQDMEAVKDE